MKKHQKQLERWSPLLLLTVIIIIWQVITAGFGVSEFIFPSPSRIWEQTMEHKVTIAGHAWRTYWVTMAGFGLAIVVDLARLYGGELTLDHAGIGGLSARLRLPAAG